MPYADPPSDVLTWTCFGLTITVTRVGPLRADLRFAGDLDLASASVLKDALQHQLDTGRRYTRVDLTDVTFLDASALGILVEAHWTFLARGGSLLLDGLSARHRRTVDIAGLGDVLLLACERADEAESAAR